MKKIIVPTDFSINAKAAAIIAGRIAKKINATITFAHVYEVPVYNLPDLAVDQQKDSQIMQFIHSEMDKIMAEPELLGLEIDQTIITDISMSDFAESKLVYDADLLVIGSNGQRTGLQEHLLGSNVDRIIRSANCPVLTVKDDNWNGELQNFVFASQFDGHASTTFQKIKNIIDLYDPTVHLVYITTPGSNFQSSSISLAEMQTFAEDWGLTKYTTNEVNAYTFEEGLFYFANKMNAEIISMTTHVENKISHLFRGSTAEDVANKAVRPVLTISTTSDISIAPIFPHVQENTNGGIANNVNFIK